MDKQVPRLNMQKKYTETQTNRTDTLADGRLLIWFPVCWLKVAQEQRKATVNKTRLGGIYLRLLDKCVRSFP